MWWGLREEGWGLEPGAGKRHLSASLLLPAGQFGGGTESYFSLLCFLLLLNVLASVLVACMVLLPTWLPGAPPGPPGINVSSLCGSYNPHTSGLIAFPSQLFNLLSGEVGVPVGGGDAPVLSALLCDCLSKP